MQVLGGRGWLVVKIEKLVAFLLLLSGDFWWGEREFPQRCLDQTTRIVFVGSGVMTTAGAGYCDALCRIFMQLQLWIFASLGRA